MKGGTVADGTASAMVLAALDSPSRPVKAAPSDLIVTPPTTDPSEKTSLLGRPDADLIDANRSKNPCEGLAESCSIM